MSLVAASIALLRAQAALGKLYGCDSGGKDSCALREVARLARVEISWHHNLTTLDPPELIRFMRREHPDTVIHRPRHGNLWHRCAVKGHMPTRSQRWCCDEYKHRRPGKDATLVMGIRHEESARRRSQWREVDTFKRRPRCRVVLPILNWDSEYLWEFLREQWVPVCELYAEGWHRLGCVGCPAAARDVRLRELNRWPQYRRGWRRAARRVWDRRAGTRQTDGREWFGSACFGSWEGFWEWWLLGRPLPDPNQLEMFGSFSGPGSSSSAGAAQSVPR